MESALKMGENPLFIKLFRGPSRICISVVYPSSSAFKKEQILRTIDALLPGIAEVPRSFYLLHSPEFPYFFSYFEIDKLRGKEPSSRQLASITENLRRQILTSSPLTPAVFWPYNKEESHRQIQLLIREMSHKNEVPHASIHFQEQTDSSLEFLIHLVRPKSSIPLLLENLPESLYFFHYSHHEIQTPFLIEIDAFSIKIQSQLFNVRDSINLLYARRYLIKQLEMIIGPFRDYNGGLFEKQQDHFESVRFALASKIPYFDLFAEKVFYALHPFERWFSLKMSEVEELFQVFSDLICNQKPCATKSTEKSGLFTVVKTENKIDFLREMQKNGKLSAYAQLTLGNYHYECFSIEVTEQIQKLLETPISEEKPLQLIFQEGSPPSLNPYYSAGDMRCRILNKLLFEGLTRLNEQGKPELAGASSLNQSEDGLIYTFQLRKTAWSNGEKVTAIDYADSWKSALQDFISHPELLYSIKNAQNFREGKCAVDHLGIRVIEPEVLQVELEKPDPQFLHKLAQPFFFPLFGNQREPKWFNGPYLVQEIKKSGLKLDRNPYFSPPLKQGFEQVEVRWLDENDEIYALFKEGKIDWIGDPLTVLSIDQIRELEKNNCLKKKSVQRRFCLHYNTLHPVLCSVSIRQALSLAIDRSFICREIFPHCIPIIPSNYSKELALAFFEEGLRKLKLNRKTFPELTFSYSDQTRRKQLALFLQNTWEKTLGIKVHLKMDTWNQFRSHLEKRNFEICGTIQDTINEDSLSFLERFEGDNSWNFPQWSNYVYRELIQTAKLENNSTKKNELKQQAEKILSENVPFTPLFRYVHLYATHSRLNCTFFDSEGCLDFSQGVKR
jgi:oligopeptide transport system substrate-binding protein